MELIRTGNLYRITKNYFTDVVLPATNVLASRHESSVRTYRIHTHTFRIEFFSPVLEQRFSKALSGLEVPAQDKVDLTVVAWDKATSAVVSPLVLNAYHLLPEVDAKGTICEDFVGVYIHGEESVTLYDIDAQKAYYYVSDAKDLPHWVDAAPLRTLLHWFLTARNMQLMHGAVVGHAGRGVLLTAPGGSGKSTTAFNCLRQGMEYLGDDYVAITEKVPITAHGLYASAKLTQDAMSHLPVLEHYAVVEAGVEKAVIHVPDVLLGHLVREAQLLAIFVPKIHSGETTYLIPAGKSDVLRAIVPTTLFQLPFARKEILSVMRTLVEELPCYFLMLGKNRDEAPETIMSFIKGAIE
ncbi:hypothetical protein K8R03_04805 [Candidatus Kaiserbacteria bacterium]|nr:hypothetical protein [Candidatus Kaiserbacteria bacterium]